MEKSESSFIASSHDNFLLCHIPFPTAHAFSRKARKTFSAVMGKSMIRTPTAS